MKPINIAFLMLICLGFALNANALEKMKPSEMKEVIAKAAVPADSYTNPDTKQNQDLINTKITPIKKADTTITHRTAGISIMIDDVVLLITKMPDVIYWDNDGV